MGFDRLALERVVRVGAVFPGQGSQAVGMGGELARHYPVAADLFRRAERVLGYDVLALARDGPEEKLRETQFSQPAIFVVNYALAAAAGEALRPVASAGHSFAEFCSLTLARALAFEDALALVHERGLAMQAAAEVAPGAMAAVLGLGVEAVGEAVARARVAGRVQLANFNAPEQIVISGDRAAVELASEYARAAGAKRVAALNVSGAWHSELMTPARERFAPFVARAHFALPDFPVISNLDAAPYRNLDTMRTNLALSVTGEVRWHATAERLLDEGLDLIVEYGASPVLMPLLRRMPGAPRVVHVGDDVKLGALLASLGAQAPA